MIVNYQTDKNGRLQSVTEYPLDTTKPTITLSDDFDLGKVQDYVLKDGTISHDPLPDPEPTREQKIAELQKKIDATNSIVLDIAIGIADKIDYADVLTERAKMQKELRELEKNV